MAAETDDGEAVSTLSEANWRPPRAGSVLAVSIVAAACWLLADALGVLDSLSVAAIGGAGVAAVVWLVGRDRFSALGTLLGVAVAPLAGGLLFVGVAYALIAQLAGLAPQGTVFAGLSVVLAGFGAASIPSDSADLERVSAAARSSLVSAIGLLVVSGALIANAVRREEEMEPLADLPLPETMPELIPETTLVPPLGSFLLIASLALLALRAALAALPVAELLDDRAGDDDDALQWFERLQSALGRATIGVVIGIVLVVARLGMESAYADLWASLPSVLADLLDGLARSTLLRQLAIRLLIVGTVVVVSVRLIRRLHRAGIRQHLGRLAVVAGAALAMAAGWMGHETILNTLIGRLETALPGAVAEVVLQQVDSVIQYYTGEVVALGLVALGGVTAAGSLAVLLLASALRVVPPRHSGHGIASAGLLAAGGFGAALGAPLAPVESFVGWVVGSTLGPEAAGHAASFHYYLPTHVSPAVVMSALAIGGGVACFLGWRRVRWATRGLLDALPVLRADGWYDRLVYGANHASTRVQRALWTGHLRTYAAWTFVGAVALAGFGYVATGVAVPNATPSLGATLTIILAVAAVAAIAAVRAPSHVAGVMALSVVGFAVTVFFVLASAPDVALTQVVVETVTFVVFLVILDKLPSYYGRIERSRAARDAVISVLVGALVTVTTLVATDAAPDSIASYFVENTVEQAGGHNIVNVILVDFRGFDTLGEISVVAMAAVTVLTLIVMRERGETP